MAGDSFYLTTAIDYANGPPHLGHALEKVGADAVARYRRLRGYDVHFVVGMDEHGLKVLQSARAASVSPQAWVDDLSRQFLAAWDRLRISNDDFIRTTQLRHHRAVEAMIDRMHASGDLYRAAYGGYYCVGCESYKGEEELTTVGAEDGGGKERLACPIHLSRELEWLEEENWFFRLSRYRERLLKVLVERPEFVQPEARRNEIRRVIEGGLEDISVSRKNLPWGVRWPDDPEQTVYVWIDALTNYLAAVGFPDDDYEEYWPADLHIIGKDITRFHCIYWPAMLMSAGVDLPRTVWAHGFVTVSGGKLSKSEGTRIELSDALARHGAEALRYFLLREIPWNGDGEFSWERFDDRYRADLADVFGNLVNRTIAMIERYRQGVVPEGEPTALDERLTDALVRYRLAMDSQLLHQGAATAIELAREANGFIEVRAPWQQAREESRAGELDATLASLARALGFLATLLSPFLPGKMESLCERIGLERPPPLGELSTLSLAGARVSRGDVLFPKD